MRPSALLVGLLLAGLVLGACGEEEASPRPYTGVIELYTAAGGGEWCGTDLTISLPPAVGRCGDGDAAVVLAAAFLDLDQLLDSVNGSGDGGLALLVPEEPEGDGPWFQMRSADLLLLEEARDKIGGVVLDGEADTTAWLDARRVGG